MFGFLSKVFPIKDYTSFAPQYTSFTDALEIIVNVLQQDETKFTIRTENPNGLVEWDSKLTLEMILEKLGPTTVTNLEHDFNRAPSKYKHRIVAASLLMFYAHYALKSTTIIYGMYINVPGRVELVYLWEDKNIKLIAEYDWSEYL